MMKVKLNANCVTSYMKRVRLQLRKKYFDRETIIDIYKEFRELENMPPVEVFADSLNDDIVCYLYSEMRYRRMSHPTYNDRIDSWYNYRRLFQSLCHNSDGLWLPNRWLWDLVDHFVNQFQSFCEFRANEKKKNNIHEPPNELAWSVFATLTLLRTVVRDSSISQTFQDQSEDKHLSDCGVPNSLGYFAKVGLLRVHCLLGQFQTGLTRLRPIELFKPEFFIHLIFNQISIAYHSAFANLMLGSHVEASRLLNEFLFDFSEFIYEHSQDYMHIKSKIKQMYALLAVCYLVSPQDHSLHENVTRQLFDFYGPIILKTHTEFFDDNSFREVLQHAWPKSTTPFEPDSYFKSTPYNSVEKVLGSMYPQECSPFDPDDKEPYKCLNQEFETLIANIRMSKLNL